MVRQYDHEVIAQTAIKPFVGPNRDGPEDAAVIAPIHGNSKGLVISCGLSPRYSDIDAGAMAVAAVDEAVRNAVCVGVDLQKIAGLDNFCWPDPIQSPENTRWSLQTCTIGTSKSGIGTNVPCLPSSMRIR